MPQLRENVEWFVQRANATSRTCAFLTRPGLQYGLSRMMAAWIEYKGYRALVTTEAREAVAWLKAQPARADESRSDAV